MPEMSLPLLGVDENDEGGIMGPLDDRYILFQHRQISNDEPPHPLDIYD